MAAVGKYLACRKSPANTFFGAREFLKSVTDPLLCTWGLLHVPNTDSDTELRPAPKGQKEHVLGIAGQSPGPPVQGPQVEGDAKDLRLGHYRANADRSRQYCVQTT